MLWNGRYPRLGPIMQSAQKLASSCGYCSAASTFKNSALKVMIDIAFWKMAFLTYVYSRCRLASPPADHSSLLVGSNSPFSELTTLSLKSTATSWDDILRLEPLLPNLQDLQIGDNGIESLSNVHSGQFRNLKCINLEDNAISTWDQVNNLEHLERLVWRISSEIGNNRQIELINRLIYQSRNVVSQWEPDMQYRPYL